MADYKDDQDRFFLDQTMLEKDAGDMEKRILVAVRIGSSPVG